MKGVQILQSYNPKNLQISVKCSNTKHTAVRMFSTTDIKRINILVPRLARGFDLNVSASVRLCYCKKREMYIYFMNSKYTFNDQEKLYFVSFGTVHWIDVFVRDDYAKIVLE